MGRTAARGDVRRRARLAVAPREVATLRQDHEITVIPMQEVVGEIILQDRIQRLTPLEHIPLEKFRLVRIVIDIMGRHSGTGA